MVNAEMLTEVKGTLSGVTVFQDCAQVTYQVVAQLTHGRHTLRFAHDGAYAGWEARTLQVRLGGTTPRQSVVLRSVRGVTQPLTAATTGADAKSKEASEAEEALKTARARVTTVEKQLAVQKKMLEMVAAVERVQLESANHLEHAEAAAAQAFLANPAKWAAMSDFLASRRAQSEERVEAHTEALRLAQRAVMRLEKRLKRKRAEAEAAVTRRCLECAVDVHTEADATSANSVVPVELLFSFQVPEASWTPTYDVRVLTEERQADSQPQLDLSYNAEVRQQTGVDWDKVSLTLSTAVPHVGAAPPSFPTPTWRVSYRQPIAQRPFAAATVRMKRYAAREETSCGADGSLAVRVPAVEEATVTRNNFVSSATQFTIPGKATVPSDGEAVRLMVAQRRFPTKLTYTTLPVSDPTVYLTGTCKNTSPFLLLPGPSNVFFNNTFINKSVMGQVPAGSGFTVSLGSDDAITVSRTDRGTPKTTARDGVFGEKKTTHTHGCTMRLRNTLTNMPVNVVVRDHYPISSDPETLKVSLVSPNPSTLKVFGSEYAEGAAVNPEDNMVEWHVTLRPKEKRTIDFEFTVKHPADREVLGI